MGVLKIDYNIDKNKRKRRGRDIFCEDFNNFTILMKFTTISNLWWGLGTPKPLLAAVTAWCIHRMRKAET